MRSNLASFESKQNPDSQPGGYAIVLSDAYRGEKTKTEFLPSRGSQLVMVKQQSGKSPSVISVLVTEVTCRELDG